MSRHSLPRETTGNEVVLTIRNKHFEGCGKPPEVSPDRGRRTCYFENVHGEQFVIQFDRESGVCQLWAGDVGWGEELRVEEFRGHVIVRFARTRAERKADPRMNTQFAGLPEPSESQEREIRERFYAA